MRKSIFELTDGRLNSGGRRGAGRAANKSWQELRRNIKCQSRAPHVYTNLITAMVHLIGMGADVSFLDIKKLFGFRTITIGSRVNNKNNKLRQFVLMPYWLDEIFCLPEQVISFKR